MDGFTDFLINHVYKLIEQNDNLKIIKYEKDGLFIKIIQEANSKKFIDISRTNNQGWEGWYDMGIIYFFISKLHFEKGKAGEFEQLSQFFMDHYNEILESFSSANYAQTEIELAELKKERAKVLFGR